MCRPHICTTLWSLWCCSKVVGIKVDILFGMCLLSVDGYLGRAIVQYVYESVKESQGAIFFYFVGKLNVGAQELMCAVKFTIESGCRMVDVSSTYLYHIGDHCGAVRRALISKSSIYKFAMMGDTVESMAVPCCCW